MRKCIIQTKIKEMRESLKLVEENLPDDYKQFSKMGLVKDGIYKSLKDGILSIHIHFR
ncbi:MAG: hypothetical protein ACOC6G_01415 [Thermoproteota archaeon]